LYDLQVRIKIYFYANESMQTRPYGLKEREREKAKFMNEAPGSKFVPNNPLL
jgi:hypothetical protein